MTPLRKHIKEEANRLRCQISTLKSSLITGRKHGKTVVTIERTLGSSDSTRRDSELMPKTNLFDPIDEATNSVKGGLTLLPDPKGNVASDRIDARLSAKTKLEILSNTLFDLSGEEGGVQRRYFGFSTEE